MSRYRPTDRLGWVFEIALILKGLDGVLETIGGLLLLFVPAETLNTWLVTVTQHELSEDPHDFVFSHLLSSGQHILATSLTFAGLYLLTHGLVKVVLVVAVLRDKLWAYPWMMGFLALFIVYQCYLLAIRFSIGLTLLTIFDVFVLWLTYHEYGRRRVTL